jgi:hypothetical protein
MEGAGMTEVGEVENVTDFFELGFEISHRKTHFINPNNANDNMFYHFSSTLNS